MATKTKKTKTKTKTIKKLTSLLRKPKFAKNLLIVVLVGATSFLLAKKYKSQFIVATVNYHPISRFQLNQVMGERYANIVLDELINQALIKDLLKENKIEITSTEIEKEITHLKEQLGGDEAFGNALAQYGLTVDKLKERLQITLGQKALSKKLFDLQVTDDEVADYYQQNKALFEQKTLEEVKDEIKANLLDQKLQQEFTTWFGEQREKASIRSFI